MFMNTIAVGPFDPVAFWVTGGATVAIRLLSDGLRHCERVAKVVNLPPKLVRDRVADDINTTSNVQ